MLSVADALDHPAAETVLRIGNRTAGRRATNIDRYLREGRDSDIAYDVFTDHKVHGQMEAAITKVATERRLSRTTIFAAITRAARTDLAFRTMDDGSVHYSAGAKFRQFENWLNLYLPSPRKQIL